MKFRQIKFAKNSNKSEWNILNQDLRIEDYVFPAGTQYKAFETANFGWIVIHPDTKINGIKYTGRRIFKVE